MHGGRDRRSDGTTRAAGAVTSGERTRDSARTISYDAFNRVVEVDRTVSTALGPKTNVGRYTYDASGRRVHRFAQINSADGAATTLDRVSVWDGAREIEEFNAADGTAAARFVYGSGDLDEAITYEPVPADPAHHTYYFYQDAQYSTAVIADESGSIAERYTYSSIYGAHGVSDRLGNPIASQNEVGNPFRFQGRRWDAESGLYYFRNRYYDPALGRFISRDPVLSQYSAEFAHDENASV